MTKEIYITLAHKYCDDEELVLLCWNEIEVHYSKSNRHYHNLNHLMDLYAQLSDLKNGISDWDTLLFSLFYHDVIYNSRKQNNEEKSAELAVKRMLQLGLPPEKVSKCKDQIIATKSHQEAADPDTNFFTDADLSILGRDRDTYRTYCANIRKEYAIYPGFIYNKGRKKVVRHFLEMERIFKTKEFFERFEMQARDNLEKELRGLI